ncbi:MAG: S46 family peptidase [Caulobacterales bacterium]|nr:S46 family peptidase [Caulobacterales bacterium]
MNRVLLTGAVLAVGLALAASAGADEGMWTFDGFPAARVQEIHGVKVDQAWLDRVRAASVRIPGCSASVVSRDGLVLTNNHCVVSCLTALSDDKTDHLKDGFLTAAREEERTCPGMTGEVLVATTDITAQINAATAGKTGKDFGAARDAAITAAEDVACRLRVNARCQAISLYRGGRYVVYRYRRYTDLRLVFAPEFATAFFGGDPDNFNFPRYDMDSAFLRLYEHGKPVKTPVFLKWNPAAPRAGEATFVSGNPGSTERLLTVAQLETARDLSVPIGQLQRAELRGRLIEFGRRSPDAQRQVADAIFSNENGFKVAYGRQLALNNAAFMAAKRKAEAQLRAAVAADPALAARIGDPWSEIEAIQTAYARDWMPYRQLEAEAGRGSKLFDYARALVRAAEERPKASADRLAEYADSRLLVIERRMLAVGKLEPELEQLNLEFWLLKTREYLGTDRATLDIVLGKESPEALAARLVADTKLGDPAVRKALWEGGAEAIKASDDPLIQFVLRLDPLARAARKTWETEVTGPTERAAERVAQARFAVYGDTVYPDATFTLRLSFGKVAGWSWRGQEVTPFTTFGGLYARATGAAPYALAPRWVEARSRLDPDMVYNFVTTNDIIGGNSGSPVINARGEVIGAAFDGNIHSIAGAYGYEGTANRTVVVSTAAITEALLKVYGRDALVKELVGK